MRPRLVAARHLTVAIALGLITSIGIAELGAVVGMTDLNSKPSSAVAVVSASTGEAIAYRIWRNSWCMRQVILDRSTQPVIVGNVVGLGPDRGVFRDRPNTPRVDAAPWPCHPPTGKANNRVEYQFGWPIPCLWGAEDGYCYADMGDMLGTTHIHRVWPLADSKTNNRSDLFFYFGPRQATPCRFIASGVLSTGLIVDASLYGALWWLLLVAPLAIRRHLRLRRNHCTRCNYDLNATAQDSPCPECGATTTPHPTAAG